MIKNLSRIEFKAGEKEIHLLCESDTSTAIVKDALCYFLKVVGQIEDAAKAAQPIEEDKKEEEVNP